jgi:hypothetical protein
MAITNRYAGSGNWFSARENPARSIRNDTPLLNQIALRGRWKTEQNEPVRRSPTSLNRFGVHS